MYGLAPTKQKSSFSPAFTIIELLIVIVIIAILAVITLVAYNGIQARTRDARRGADVEAIQKALEVYYTENGSYPSCTGSGSTSINNSWCTTADSSWKFLVNQLVSLYVTAIPSDPISKQEPANTYPWTDSSGYDYSYVAASNYCGITPSTQPPQMYMLIYSLESGQRQQISNGTCNTNPLSYGASWVRTVHGGS